MSRKQKFKPAVAVANRADDPYITSGAGSVQSDKFWRWGDDNLFPNALALMARRSVTHRRIINDKADYISGKGFSCDEGHEPLLAAFIRRVNGDGESLRQVLNKLAFDKALFGNAFLEIVTDAEHSFLAFHHRTLRAAAWPAIRRTSSCTTTGRLSTPPRHGRCPSTRPSNGRRTARCGP